MYINVYQYGFDFSIVLLQFLYITDKMNPLASKEAVGNCLLIPSFNLAQWASASDISTWFEALIDTQMLPRSKGIRSLAILVCWAIWKERNARIFQDKAAKTG